MTSYVKVTLLLILIQDFMLESDQADNCNENGMKRFDEQFSLATSFGNANSRFPQSDQQLKDWCKWVILIPQYKDF